jgi:DNA-binding beta-propeller fold protein YncE/N-acetylneuraminic acid mutarotase
MPTWRRRYRITLAVVAACCLLPLAYSVIHVAMHRPSGSTRTSASTSPSGSHGPSVTDMALQVIPAPYLLPAALSRVVVLPTASGLLIAGGLTAHGASTDAVTGLDPLTGVTRAAGHLAAATHDAAGASLGGQMYLFGGGTAASVPTVQAFAAGSDAAVVGQLPAARSDASGVTAGSAAYLIGGYDGTHWDPQVLATRDGMHFQVAARLPVPVRHAAVTAAAGEIWVFGGQTPSGPTNAIQRISPATGQASVVGHLLAPLQGATAIVLGGQIYVAGGVTAGATSPMVYRFDPATSSVSAAGRLPVPVAYAAGVVWRAGEAGGAVGYLIGGENGPRPVPTVTTLRLVPAGQTMPQASQAPWLAPASGPGLLTPGSDPSMLPADVLIADHKNNRLVIVDPQGRIRWEFPRPGDLAPGQTFLEPDDAFFSPDGRYIIVTQEDDYVLSVISVATSKIIYRYGVPGVPGAGPNHLFNPDDAMLTPTGAIVSADIKNCRIVIITPPAHTLTRVIGQTTNACLHDPPRRFGSPNGAFPMTDGNYLVTEINGDWADEMSLHGAVAWSANPPGVLYPSDTNEVYPGRYLTADYSDPGQIVEFTSTGHLLWRMGGFNQPSLALPLPNGDILLNDDFNHRVCVVDPVTNRIVWQYGHTGKSGHAPGYLNDPDGVDLVPPDSLLVTHAATMGEP